jgi:hypothetical protein
MRELFLGMGSMICITKSDLHFDADSEYVCNSISPKIRYVLLAYDSRIPGLRLKNRLHFTKVI